jgi:uncharacterized membrane protein YgcG
LYAAVALGLAIPARAADAPVVQTRRLTITFFDATYDVGVDGTVDVEERITVRFEGSWNGVYRWIPVKYELTGGGRHQVYLDVQAVEDDRGNELRHEVKREGALVKIKTWVPGARDTQRTIVYRYRVENGLRYFEGDDEMQWAHDELYWNVTGDEWEMPILRVQARVNLPREAAGIKAVAYTGRRGATGRDYEQAVSGSTVLFETTNRLEMREGLTVVVGWDPGVVARPSAAKKLRWLFLDYLFLPIPIIAFFAMFRLWRKKGRDPELSRSIMPQYEPPEDMSPAEVGTLMDFSVDPRDLSATILDLAVRGYLKIEEVPSKRRKRPKDHIIHILKDPAGVTDLKDHELETLKSLWSLADKANGTYTVKVSDLKQEFYRRVPVIKAAIFRRMTQPPKLFTARPENVMGVWAGIAVVVAAICVAIGFLARVIELGHPAVSWASLIAAPVFVLVFGLAMPARTLKGAWILNHVLGLREYIDRVDRDRLKHATLEHFEKLLPFAAAMGLEEKWTEAFEAILIEPPQWYVSHYPGHFHAGYFSRSLGHMATSTGAALVTAPRSSSGGSGFGGGGGGFSGGGFGGGGGGGF